MDIPAYPMQGKQFYLWKGRVALYTILKALGVGPGDEVILPAFTCVAVANAVLYLKATPVYADIDAKTYNITVDTIRARLTRQTRVVLAQNTFGLAPDYDPILDLVRNRGLSLVEDCAHGLGGHYRGRPNGTIGDAAFFSSQWSKPISTGLGGVAVTHDQGLALRIAAEVESMPFPSWWRLAILSAQIWSRPLVDLPGLYYPLISAYRFLTQTVGLSVGSSDSRELAGSDMPTRYCTRMSTGQQKRFQQRLQHLPQQIAMRQKNADRYDDILADARIDTPLRPTYAEHTMLRYAVETHDKATLLRQAKRHGIPLGDWFSSPLHPVSGPLTRWGYHHGSCPVAESVCNRIVNLPTSTRLTEKQLATILPYLRRADTGQSQRSVA